MVEQLTARELEILALLAAGTANPRIAEQLVVSLDTVKSTSATSSASSARPTAPGRHQGRPARPHSLARHAPPIPVRHCRAMGGSAGTVVPGPCLRKIPPAMPTFG